jgi:hypothetical protein
MLKKSRSLNTFRRPGLYQTYPKSPEAEDDDDKVNSVGQEHEHIHVCHSTVLWVDQVVEELTDGDVDLQSS